jgi:hypothetical protein
MIYIVPPGYETLREARHRARDNWGGDGDAKLLVSVRKEVESHESDVMQGKQPDSGGAADVDER